MPLYVCPRLGQYVQAHDEPQPTNTQEPRTIDSIYLRPLPNGHEVYTLDTQEVIERRRLTPQPVTPAVIALVNSIAVKDKNEGLCLVGFNGQVLYDSSWTEGVDYDDREQDSDSDSDYELDDDSEDSSDEESVPELSRRDSDSNSSDSESESDYDSDSDDDLDPMDEDEARELLYADSGVPHDDQCDNSGMTTAALELVRT